MKKLFLILLLFSSIFCTSCKYFQNNEKFVAANYDTVIIVAALEEMYWLEYSKMYTADELNDIINNEELKRIVETKIKTTLEEKHLVEIVRIRKDSHYDF
jgi:hypothetical protein